MLQNSASGTHDTRSKHDSLLHEEAYMPGSAMQLKCGARVREYGGGRSALYPPRRL